MRMDELSNEEVQVVELLRNFRYGEITIYKQNDKPVRVEATASFLLISKDDQKQQ